MTEQRQLSNYPEVKVYKRRWLMLMLFGLLIMTNNCIWISLSSVTATIVKYYDVSALMVGTVTTFSSVCTAVLAIPASFIVSKYGLRLTAIILAGLNAIGASIRIGGLAQNQFAFVAAGQFITSLGTIFALISPPQVAATWFPCNERTFATTFGMIMDSLGVAGGFVMSACMITDSGNPVETANGIRNLFIVQAALSLVFFVITIEIFEEAPPKPPSISESFRTEMAEEGQELPFWHSLVELLRDKDYIQVSIAYSFNYAVLITSQTIISQLLINNPPIDSVCNGNLGGWIGFIASCASMLSSAVLSLMVDKWKNFKQVACVEMGLATIILIEFALVVHYDANLYIISTSYVFVMLISYPYAGVGLDHLSEIAYPVREGCASMLPVVLGNIGSVTLVYSAQLTIQYGYKDFVTYGFYGMEGFALLLSLLAKAPARRSLTDNIPPMDIPSKPPRT